jgi:hypothetical protein
MHGACPGGNSPAELSAIPPSASSDPRPLRLWLGIADFVDPQVAQRADEYTALALAHGWPVKAQTLVHRIQMASWREQAL